MRSWRQLNGIRKRSAIHVEYIDFILDAIYSSLYITCCLREAVGTGRGFQPPGMAGCNGEVNALQYLLGIRCRSFGLVTT